MKKPKKSEIKLDLKKFTIADLEQKKVLGGWPPIILPSDTCASCESQCTCN